MDVKNPRTLIGSAVYIEDDRYIGTVEEIELPDLEFGSVETGAGMKREQVVPVLEAMKARIKVSGDNHAMVKLFAKQVTENGIVFVRNDTTTARHDSLDVTLKGNGKVLKAPIPGVGEKMETEIEMNIDVYVYMINGQKYYEIDALNMVCVIDGKDLMAETRANL